MATIFASFAVSATMFPQSGSIQMRPLTETEAREMLPRAMGAFNPSHATTIAVFEARLGIALPIPEKAPKVSLRPGDSLIILSANLPRLAEGQVHSDETVKAAPLSYLLWTVDIPV